MPTYILLLVLASMVEFVIHHNLADHAFIEHYQSLLDKLFKGYRLIACDGSNINIAHNPTDLEAYLKSRKSKGFHSYFLCHFGYFCDIWILQCLYQQAKSLGTPQRYACMS